MDSVNPVLLYYDIILIVSVVLSGIYLFMWHKHFDVKGAGQADILLVPSYETGNGIGKAMSIFGGAMNAGIVVGAKVPIVLVSRADSAEVKLAAMALGAVVARGM